MMTNRDPLARKARKACLDPWVRLVKTGNRARMVTLARKVRLVFKARKVSAGFQARKVRLVTMASPVKMAHLARKAWPGLRVCKASLDRWVRLVSRVKTGKTGHQGLKVL